jgi:hypothetical protein
MNAGRPFRDTIPTPKEALALMTVGNIQLAIIKMSTFATSFYDAGDSATADYFAALVVELAEAQDRQKAAREFFDLELRDLGSGGLATDVDDS